MLIEDMTTQHKRTVTYMLEDVIQEEDNLNEETNVIRKFKESVVSNTQRD